MAMFRKGDGVAGTRMQAVRVTLCRDKSSVYAFSALSTRKEEINKINQGQNLLCNTAPLTHAYIDESIYQNTSAARQHHTLSNVLESAGV